MTVLAVDPEALYAAGSAVVAVGEGLGAAMAVLTAGFGANTGSDIAGELFGLGYQSAAESLLKSATAAVNACQQIGALIQQGASNYSIAEAASNLGGGAGVLQPPAAPTKVAAPRPPGTLGPGEPPPPLWAVVQPLVDSLWPDGDVAGLHAAAGCWRTFASAVGGMSGALSGPGTLIGTQQMPERFLIIQVLTQMEVAVATLSGQCDKMAALLDSFAKEVGQAQHDIRDLLQRLGSLTDLWHDVELILDGDALDEIRKIAQDVNAVLHELGRQARAFEQGIKLLMHVADGLVVDLEKFMRGQFKNFLGDVVGNKVANDFDFAANVIEGLGKGVVQATLGMVDLGPGWIFLDPKGAETTWKSTLESQFKASAVNQILHPKEGVQANAQMWKSLLHLDDWSGDRPGLGLGENIADGLMLMLPGVGEVGAGAEAGSAAARGAEEAGEAAGAAGRVGKIATSSRALGDISNVGTNLTKDLDNLKLDASKADIPAAGRPMPAPPTEVPGAPAPRPVESAPPGTPSPHSPTAPGGAGPGRPGAPGAPHDAPTPGAGGGPREPMSVPASPSEQLLSHTPQLAEPAPARVPGSTNDSPAEVVPAPTQAPALASSAPQSSTPHFTSPSASPPEFSHPGGDGWHGPGDGGPSSAYQHEPGLSGSDDLNGAPGRNPSDVGPHEPPHREGEQADEAAVDDLGGPDRSRHAISGHGAYDPARGDISVPPGTTITVYAEHGSSISDALGNLIETGGDTSGVYSKTFASGESMPNYTIYPPDGLNIMGGPQTVLSPTHLSDLLAEDMGPVDLAVCTYDPTCPTGKVYDVDGIFDEWTGIFKAYER
ncbi:putative adhesin [Mycobacterium rhizamassiliense]|nr:hypothetical protein [Mycobacterium rhizamassiliense]